jgi:beta-glucosidase
MKFKICLLSLLVGLPALTVFSSLHGQDKVVYLDKAAPLEDRVHDLMARLTEPEKMSFLCGASNCTTPAIPRLQVPSMVFADAGAGVRGIGKPNTGPATSFCCGTTMASTWDPAFVGRIAAAIGEEARNKKEGSQILLGPAVNIQRSPLGGRNSEYFSEDPFLAARIGVGYILGMQGEGTGACIKHFACNNVEFERRAVDTRVSERALREIYLPAFEAGVKEGHVWTLMSSYNRVNGPHASADSYLLTDVLKKGWGFDGMVVSDWGGIHQTAATINAGNDLEMGGHLKFRAPANVDLALKNGQTTTAAIDDCVRRTLRTIVRTGLLDGPWQTDPSLVNSPEHQELTRELAEQGSVLLKNEGGILPLDTAKIRSIAVIGLAANKLQMGSRGSPDVTPFYFVSPLEGLIKRAGSTIAIHFAPGDPDNLVSIPASAFVPDGDETGHGLRGAYFSNANLEGTPVQTRTDADIDFNWTGKDVGIPGIGPENFSVRWKGRLIAPTTGKYRIALAADDGCRFYLDGKKVFDRWQIGTGKELTVDLDLVAGEEHAITLEYFQATGDAFARLRWRLPGADQVHDAVAAAKNSDVAIVFASTYGTEGEGHDRPSMALPQNQDRLIQAVAAANKRTIVILNNGTPMDLRSWIKQVSGLLEVWYPGQEGGNAIAALLFGDVNPSGKLPNTFGERREDYCDYGNFPGEKNRINYEEGIYVGYRHFDKENIAPLFPFGFGLSYTTFAYGPVKLSQETLDGTGTVSVTVPVTNTGTRRGQEVVELYVHDPAPKIDKAVRELKGFAKIALEPGETKPVTLPITPRDLAYFDVPGKQWKADAGDYEIQIGASSRDIRQKTTIHLASAFTEAVPDSVDQLALNGGFGKGAAPDLAAGQPVQASSSLENFGPERAVDTDDTTHWSSEAGDPQWLMVNLAKTTTIGSVRLFWGDEYALDYALQVSDDGKAWTDVARTSKGMGDIEWVRFAPTKARWVRVLASQPGKPGAGYTLNSFEVYSPDKHQAITSD